MYNITFNYIEYCKGKIVPYGGSINAVKEGYEDGYDKPLDLLGINCNSTAHAKYIVVLIQMSRFWSVRLQ